MALSEMAGGKPRDDSAAGSSGGGSSPRSGTLPGADVPQAANDARRWGLPALPAFCPSAAPAVNHFTASTLSNRTSAPTLRASLCHCSKLPFEPLSVTFKDITYDVPRPKNTTGQATKDAEVPDDTLRLLRHINGAFRPGVLTALMGASGAGKTT